MKLKLLLNVFLLLGLTLSLQSCLDPEFQEAAVKEVDNLGIQGHGNAEVNFSFPESSAMEGSSDVIVRVKLNTIVKHDVTVDFVVAGANGAIEGSDFELVGTNSVFIAAGEVEGYIKINLIDDGIRDAGEQVLLVLQQSSDMKLGKDIIHRLSIMDKAQVAASNVGFILNAASIAEDAGSISVEIGMDKINSVPVRVDFELLGTATKGPDYSVMGPEYVVIPAGELSKSFILSITNDTAQEDLEDIVLNITNVAGANLMASNGIQVINIIDNDKSMPSNLPLVSFALQSSTEPEAKGTANVVVKLDKVSTSDVNFNILNLGNAIEGQDYTLAASTGVIPAGQIQVMIPVALIDDLSYESAAEYVQLVLSNIKGAMPGLIASHSLSILDDDGAGGGGPVLPNKPLIAFNQVVSTGVEGTSVNIDMSLDRAATGATTFDLALTGNALQGSDYNLSATSITIAEGSLNAQISISILDDTLYEPTSESVFLIISNASSNVIVGQVAVHQLIIQDNDPSGNNTPTLQETFATTVWPVLKLNCAGCHATNNTRPKFANSDLSIAFAGMAGEYDLTNTSNSPVYTNPAGGHQGKAGVAPDILNALNDWKALMNPNSPPPAGPPALNFSNSNSLLTEVDTTSNVQVKLDKVHTAAVTFQVAMSGAATYSQDYTLASSSITIPAGQLTANVVVNILDDTAIEPDEDIVLILTNISGGAALGSNIVHYKKILDNDQAQANLAPEVQAFKDSLYPYLVNKCATCHKTGGAGLGKFAEPDVSLAHTNLLASNKVNFGDPIASRLVQKQLENHNCSGNDCQERADSIKNLIDLWVQKLQNAGLVPPGTSGQSIVSTAISFASASGNGAGNRVTDGLISLYEFKEGSGNTTADTSGVTPAMNLALENTTWVEGGGIEFKAENNMPDAAIASQASSVKLYNQIAAGGGSGQYSIEAWVAPANVAQNGPARIVSYSTDTGNRNFTLGQIDYSYDFRNRSATTGVNGTPSAATPNGDEKLKAQLQHVVAIYGPNGKRKIFVDGVDAGAVEAQNYGSLATWNNAYRFVLGNEVTKDRQFEGVIKLVAIYKKELTAAEIQQNYNSGFGKKVDLEFDISAHAGPNTKIVLTVSEFDNYSYLIENPRFKGVPSGAGVRIKAMNIAINDKTPEAGQAYKKLDLMVTQPDQPISAINTIILKDLGANLDVFKLQFDILGESSNPSVPLKVSSSTLYKNTAPSPITAGLNGVRTFQEVNETMAAITGVNPNVASIKTTYDSLKTQLPLEAKIENFLPANQIGIIKLSLSYCNVMMQDATLRSAFFPGFNFGTNAVAAFDTQAEKDIIVDNIYEKMVGEGLSNQPDKVDVKAEVEGLIDDLTNGCSTTSCPASRTRTVVTSACAAVLGSAAVTIK